MEHRAVAPKNTVPTNTPNRRYIFGDYVLLATDKVLLFQQTPVQTDPKTIDFLATLIDARPDWVSKEQLMSKLWPDTIVSDWSLARLVSDTRKLLRDDGKTQSIIKTIRGKGYAFTAPLDEIIEAYPKASGSPSNQPTNSNAPPADALDSADDKVEQSGKPVGYMWAGAIGLIMLLVLASFFFITRKNDTTNALASKVVNTSHLSTLQRRVSVMLDIKKNLQLTKTAFLAQSRRRNELGNHILKKNPELKNLSWEQRFKQYYPHLTRQEKFLYDQIRSITQGPLYKANSALLTLLHQHPEMYQEIDLLFTLNSHLEIWINKYEQVFLNHDDMPLVYVGVEDGVPFPSKIDGRVDQWLSENAALDKFKPSER